MKPDPNVGSEDEFEEFGPIPPISGESLWEFREVRIAGVPDKRVWTVVDDGGETECWYAEPGFHIVNVMGYMVTQKPWTDEGKSYYWYFDSRDRYRIDYDEGDEEYVFAEDEADARERGFDPMRSIVQVSYDGDE
jgi:hypothetical protein